MLGMSLSNIMLIYISRDNFGYFIFSTQNGAGAGSVGCTLKRVTSDRSSHDFDISIGSGPYLGAKYYRRIYNETFFNVSGRPYDQPYSF